MDPVMGAEQEAKSRIRFAAFLLAGMSVVAAVVSVARITSSPAVSTGSTTTVEPSQATTTQSNSTTTSPPIVELADIDDPALADWSSVDLAGVEPDALIEHFALTTGNFELPWFKDMLRAYNDEVEAGDEALVVSMVQAAVDEATATDDAGAMAVLIDASYNWGRPLSAPSTDFVNSVNAIRNELEAALPDAAFRSTDPALVGPELDSPDAVSFTETLIVSEYFSSFVFTTVSGEALGHIRVSDTSERRDLAARLIGPRPGSAANHRIRLAPTDPGFPEALRAFDDLTTAIASSDGRFITGLQEAEQDATASAVLDTETALVTEYDDRCYVARFVSDTRYLVCDATDGSRWTQLRAEATDGTQTIVSGVPPDVDIADYDQPDWGWHDAQVQPSGAIIAQFASAVTCPTTRVQWFPSVHLVTDSKAAALRIDDGRLFVAEDGEYAPAILLGILDDSRSLVRVLDTCVADNPEGVYALGPDNDIEFLAVGNGLTFIFEPSGG